MYFSIQRSYLAESTGSRPISEVKLSWAYLVLRWGTTRESWVLLVFDAHLDIFVTWHRRNPKYYDKCNKYVRVSIDCRRSVNVNWIVSAKMNRYGNPTTMNPILYNVSLIVDNRSSVKMCCKVYENTEFKVLYYNKRNSNLLLFYYRLSK